MKLVDRFLEYVKFDTKSDENSPTCPSTDKQLVFARFLRDQLESMGLEEISLDENGYLMASLPSNVDREVPVVGFIAHMDTAPDMSGKDVNPRIVSDYDGKDIVLNKEQNIVLSPSYFPELLDYKGQDIIVTDGTTLLGADDKAGIAEIVQAIEYLIEHPEIKHGKIRIGFTPDEEIGRGADKFDVERFGAAFAYTMDGGAIGELEYENFNAASATISFKGCNVHPGSAKDKMINSILVANKFMNMLPASETPSHTEGYEGFYHAVGIEGTVENTVVRYIIRDHDRAKYEARKAFIKECAERINKEYPGCCEAVVKDQYFNMREKIEPVMYVVELAEKAMREAGVEPKVQPIRGGTDGARLSFMGLPCPNIFAGGMNFHGRYEYLPIPSLEKASEVVALICKGVAEKY